MALTVLLHPRSHSQVFKSEVETDSDENNDGQMQQAVDNIMQATARVRLPVENVMIFPVDSEPVLNATLGEFVARHSTSTVMSLLPVSVSTRGALDDLRAMVRLLCNVLAGREGTNLPTLQADQLDAAVFCAKAEPCGVLSIEI